MSKTQGKETKEDREPQVVFQILKLRQQIDELAETAGEVVERLQPILRDEEAPEDESETTGQKAAELVPVAADIRSCAWRIEALNAKFRRVFHRAEV